ncbi:MAG: ribosomal RNA small subunit methyltransferase A [Chloroflexi bacterium]|nr:ribosomal RNA small subunit methyltransferase A [Chloroflexota bacterium]
MPKKASPPSVQVGKLLRQSGIRPKKRLGQHFLVDEAILDTIVVAAELSPEDIVIEIGPGLGVLTAELARGAGKVIAVELDTKLALLLKRRLASLANVDVINADILKVSPSQLLETKSDYKVVANLPYYITSPILRRFVEASLKPSLMVVMVQKEVGNAIVAGPGEMSLLAVSLQVYSKPKIVSYVPSQSFYPPPKVDSAIVRFDLLPEPAVKVADINGFFQVVKCGFTSPRKQLHNSLAQGMGVKPAEVALLLERAGIESQRRAETLSLEEWARLYEVWAASRKD